jgi:hypothetical protein
MRASGTWAFVGTIFPIKAQVYAIKGFQKLLLYASNFSEGSFFDESVGLWVGSHCVYFQHTTCLFDIPGSAFTALSAAGIPTNLPLAGQGHLGASVECGHAWDEHNRTSIMRIQWVALQATVGVCVGSRRQSSCADWLRLFKKCLSFRQS